MDIASSTDLPVRRHAVGGTYNLRDVGGYPAATGITRWGKLFRSDALHRLDEESRVMLADLGITRVVDLRDARELDAAPSRIDGLGITVDHLPIFEDAAPDALALGTATLATVYAGMVERHGANLTRAIRVIALSGNEPVLVHCTAGKDRTGMVIALALLAAGVDRAAVVADYALTEENLRGEWADGMRATLVAAGGTLTASLDALLSASPPALLEAVLSDIEAQHGSVRNYLLENGLSVGELESLRDALVDPA